MRVNRVKTKKKATKKSKINHTYHCQNKSCGKGCNNLYKSKGKLVCKACRDNAIKEEKESKKAKKKAEKELKKQKKIQKKNPKKKVVKTMQKTKEIGVKAIPRTQLVGNKYNPRKRFDTAKMRNLQQSIESIGLIQPLLVRPIGKDKYEVVAGMRRFMASKNSSSIPCYIREMDDKEAQLLALTENLERADLSPMEEARAMANYLDYTPSSEIENYQMIVLKTQKKGDLDTRIEKLAKKIPPEKNTVYRRLKLLDLHTKVQTMVDNKNINIAEAETLVSLKEMVDIKIKSLPEGLSEEEKIEEYQKAWKECHNSMWSIAKNIPKRIDSKNPEIKYSDIPALKGIIKQRITDITRTTSAQAEQQSIFQKRFDSAKSNLINSLIETEENEVLQDILEYDFDEEFGDLLDKEKETTKEEWILLKEKSREILDEYEEKLKSMGDEESKRIRKIKTEVEEEMDRSMITKRIVDQEVIDYCPYCGAGIEVDNLNKRITDANNKIKELNKRESHLATEVRTLNNTVNTLKRLRGDYKQRLTALLATTESKTKDV